MDYIIPSRGKRRRIIAGRADESDGKDADDSTTNIINRGRTSSVGGSTAASTAASDTDEGEEDPLAEEESQLQNEIILKKWQRANGEGDEDQLLHTSSRAKLFEYVKSNDGDGEDGTWTFRGEGQVKFIRCLEEGYNRGMIRMELTKNFTLETLMCHEITTEDVSLYHSSHYSLLSLVVVFLSCSLKSLFPTLFATIGNADEFQKGQSVHLVLKQGLGI